jgi:predicted HD phosphohydrolase
MVYEAEAEKTAREIIGLYRNYGNEDYIGEPVSQIEHMCQCALLAEAEGYNEDIIMAAFFTILAIYVNISCR